MVFLGVSRGVALQSAKMRIPSIKFRKGSGPASGHAAPGAGAAPQQAKGSQQQATVVLQELPHRFRRQPISEEEIEYINRGGPA